MERGVKGGSSLVGGWLITGALLLGVGLATWAPTASMADSGPAARELAEKYSPVMNIREQQDPLCGTEGEQYQAMKVDALFDNPDVKLMRNLGNGGKRLVKRAPAVEDIRNRGEEYYLDLPGDPLGDTCVYAKDFDRLKREGKAPVAVYAHVTKEKGRSGLALQYWFYWYFNQFNDLHESDWEGMQLTFDAETPEEALRQEPSEMILFQHAGGERAYWGDTKVEKEGSRPVVYPAAGSHATFYQSAIYPQNGWNGAGVGCDITSEPLRELRPQAVLLPTGASGQGDFAWLSFDGRWGQKEASFNNGPTGPQTKEQWTKPFSWMEQQRWSSPRMPGGGLVGPDTVNAFCGVMETVTSVMNLEQADPVAAAAIVGVFLLVVFLIFGFSRWRPADPDNLEQERSYGQIVGTAFKLYARHWRVFTVLGAIAIPLIGGTQALGSWLGDMAGGDGFLQTSSDLLLGVGMPVANALVSALVIVSMRNLVRGEGAGLKSSVLGTKQRFWRVVTARLLAIAGTTLMALTIIGIPFALRYLVSWAFVQQEVIFTDKSLREAFRTSTDLVRGRWLHSVRTIVPLTLLLGIMGPMLGLVLIFTPMSLLLINLIGSLAFALTIPFVSTGTTLLYLDLTARQETQGAVPKRSWAVWRPSTFGRRQATA